MNIKCKCVCVYFESVWWWYAVDVDNNEMNLIDAAKKASMADAFKLNWLASVTNIQTRNKRIEHQNEVKWQEWKSKKKQIKGTNI